MRHTRKPQFAASRLPSFQSQTRTGTVAGRFPVFTGKADSVSPIPARIALQGGERANSDAICPCPSQEKSVFRDISGRSNPPSHGSKPPVISRPVCPVRLCRQDTRTKTFLRNLLTIARNPGEVNAFGPAFREFRGKIPALFDGVQFPCAVFERKIGHAPNAQLVPGIMGNVHQRFGHAIHLHSLPVFNALGR